MIGAISIPQFQFRGAPPQTGPRIRLKPSFMFAFMSGVFGLVLHHRSIKLVGKKCAQISLVLTSQFESD
jgi:hypothetical protein